VCTPKRYLHAVHESCSIWRTGVASDAEVCAGKRAPWPLPPLRVGLTWQAQGAVQQAGIAAYLPQMATANCRKATDISLSTPSKLPIVYRYRPPQISDGRKLSLLRCYMLRVSWLVLMDILLLASVLVLAAGRISPA